MARHAEELFVLFEELRDLTILDDGTPQSFRARAYDKALRELRGADANLAELSEAQLVALDGVGKATAQKVREYFATGQIAKLEQLRAKFPPGYRELAKVPGVGPKMVARLVAELGIENLQQLRDALAVQAIRGLKGLGAATEEKIARGLQRASEQAADQRTPIAKMMRVARQLVDAMAELPQVQQVQYCGSLRRLAPTIGDIDILVATNEPQAVSEHFLQLPLAREASLRGEARASIITYQGLQADLRVVTPEQFGAALLYFTGSAAHNIKLRQLALRRGWTLNEYGLFDGDSDGELIAARTEHEIYAALELQMIAPPMREDTGEVEAAARGELPAQLTLDDIHGDLHLHTDLSGDGRCSLEEMVQAARQHGYQYLAITDHAEDMGLNGVTREELLEQRTEIARLQEQYPDIALLHGVELNIAPDGGLDYDPAFRSSLQWCVAAAHSQLSLSREQQTQRVIRAMEDGAVNVIGHLSGRMIGRRPGMDLDIDAVLAAATRTGCAIEINGALPRLDASAEVLRKARGLGVTIVISTDSHHVSELERMQWGVAQAQRGWVDPKQIANTWPAERFLDWANARRRAAASA